MLIIGAKGLAKELLEVCKNTDNLSHLVFYDNVDLGKDVLYNEFPILHDETAVLNYFKTKDKRFVLGFGDIKYRIDLFKKFEAIGGEFTSLISPNALVGSYNVQILRGTTIMPGAIVSNSTSIGMGCLVYFNALITHDVKIEDFTIISPGVKVLGRAKIGSKCLIGANATILPDVNIGSNVIIAAGAVVTKDIPANCMVAGIPASIKRQY